MIHNSRIAFTKDELEFMKIQRSAKRLVVVARNVFLLLLNFSAWPCLAVA